MTPRAPDRDIRIDLIRGLALWMIFADHVSHNVARFFTYHRLGFSDAGEIFVFLSGISCSLVYGKLLAREGWRGAMRRATRRAVEIYAGYLAVLAATAAIFLLWRHALGDQFLDQNEMLFMAEEPIRAIIAAVMLAYTPQFLDILPLYMVLVLVTPAVLRALCTAPAATLLASAVLWAAAGILPWLHVPNLVPSGVAGYNPFSWQFLFCIGLWVGQHHFAGDRPFLPIRWVTAVCWAVLAVNLALRIVYDIERSAEGVYSGFIETLHELASSDTEHVVRLTHFLAVAYIAAGLLRADAGFMRSVALRPLVWCGRHSLEVFCVGVVLSDLLSVWFVLGRPGAGIHLVANAAGCAAMSSVALLLEMRRRTHQRARFAAA